MSPEHTPFALGRADCGNTRRLRRSEYPAIWRARRIARRTAATWDYLCRKGRSRSASIRLTENQAREPIEGQQFRRPSERQFASDTVKRDGAQQQIFSRD